MTTSNFPVETVDADDQFMEANAAMFHVNDNAISVQITAGPEGGGVCAANGVDQAAIIASDPSNPTIFMVKVPSG